MIGAVSKTVVARKDHRGFESHPLRLLYILSLRARTVGEAIPLHFASLYNHPMKKNATPPTVDTYITSYLPEIQAILFKIRRIILDAAPSAVESFAYGMPAYKLKGKPLVYFAAFEKHIGFYPIPSGIEAFKEEFSHYKGGKGSVQFPLDKPIPYDLIERIVKFRVAEMMQ